MRVVKWTLGGCKNERNGIQHVGYKQNQYCNGIRGSEKYDSYLERIIRGKVNVEKENSAGIRRVFWSHDGRLPVEHIITDWSGRAIWRRILSKIDQFLWQNQRQQMWEMTVRATNETKMTRGDHHRWKVPEPHWQWTPPPTEIDGDPDSAIVITQELGLLPLG